MRAHQTLRRKLAPALLTLLLAATILAAACGGKEKGTSTPSQFATPTVRVLTSTETPTAPSPSLTPILTPTPTPTPGPEGQLDLAAFSDAVAAVVGKVEPAVVFVSVDYTTSTFFGETATSTKSGSGVIMDPSGYILTNNHVIDSYNTITVTLPNDPKAYDAKLIGADPTSDLAVIKINGNNFPFAQFGDASQLKVGNWVIAVGNPEGLQGGPTVTQGIIGSLERSFNIGNSVYYDTIQTDAAINPGNSGGPLINLKDGKVIGINSFILTGTQGLGFAISSDTAQKVYSELVASGKVSRPYLGAGLQSVTPDLVTQLKLSQNTGVVIVSLGENGPAAKAGLKVNDVITAINGQPVLTDTKLLKVLWLQYKAGDQIEITFWRGNQQMDVTVVLAERTS
jgi:serine protease Do